MSGVSVPFCAPQLHQGLLRQREEVLARQKEDAERAHAAAIRRLKIDSETETGMMTSSSP
jgi:hypothetical protein